MSKEEPGAANNTFIGYWGTPTATIDWCEVNYEVTHYVAEFWNTISNFLMIILPLYGLWWSLKMRKKYQVVKKHNRNLNLNPFNINNLNIPFSIISCHIGLMLVGIGSWMFHMTLLYSMQLLDEIPMVWGSGLIIYANYDLICSTFTRQSQRIKYLALVLDIVYCAGVTYFYIYHFTNPLFHEVSYGIQVFVIIIENIYLINKLNLSPRLYLLSFVYYLFGFVLWNIDNNLCGYLKLYRSTIDAYIQTINDTLTTGTTVGLVLTKCLNGLLILLKSFSEFHSLWHLFTGYGAYLTILFLLDAHYENQLIKRITKSESSSSFHELKDHIKEHYRTKRLHNRPIKAKMYRLVYNLDNEYVKRSASNNNNNKKQH